MKRILSCSLVLLIVLCFLCGCENKEDTASVRPETMLKHFAAKSAVIQTEEESVLLEDADCQNFRLWVLSCPIMEETKATDITDWTYRILFCDAEKLTEQDGVYFLPHTAQLHTVLIDEERSLIQFDSDTYEVDTRQDRAADFYEGVRVYRAGALKTN